MGFGVLGVRQYDGRTKTSQGIFAAVTSKQVEAICDDPTR
jgi:hypothetical protein